jgi:hypothetical protein
LHNTGGSAEMPLIIPFFVILWFQLAALWLIRGEPLLMFFLKIIHLFTYAYIG